MVPRAVCSLRNWESSPCSVRERRMVLLMRVAGAPGFRSMAWSQVLEGGNPFAFRRRHGSLDTGGEHCLIGGEGVSFVLRLCLVTLSPVGGGIELWLRQP